MRNFYQERSQSPYFSPFLSAERGYTETEKPVSPAEKGIFYLPTHRISVEERVTRAKQNEILRLAQRIRKYGLDKPLSVRLEGENTPYLRYVLAEESSRWQAACLAEAERVPCILQENTPKNSAEEAILAQITHKKLHIFDQAEAFRILMQDYGLTQGEIAQRCGISQSSVANKLRLLQLSPEERRLILRENLTERHARALLRLRGEARWIALEQLCREHPTVAESEALIEEMLHANTPDLTPKSTDLPLKPPFLSTFSPLSPLLGQGEGAPLSHPQAPKKPTQEQPALVPEREYRGFSNAPQTTEKRARQKIAIQSLEPLYVSLDRPLSILRRAGCSTEMQHEQHGDDILIHIRISKATK